MSLGSGIRDPGSRGQKGTQSRIPDPDPQHWLERIAQKVREGRCGSAVSLKRKFMKKIIRLSSGTIQNDTR